MSNKQFFKEQFKRRQLAVKHILFGTNSGLSMRDNQLSKLIATNIRGMDPESAQDEIRRLNVLNKGLGFRLPEKQRIEKLVYAEGRKELNRPVLSISESINKLGDRLTDQSLKLPFGFRKYQPIIEIAQRQNNIRFTSEEVVIIDVLKNIYSIYDPIDLEINNQIDNDLLQELTSKVLVNDSFIVLYLNPHDHESKRQMLDLNKIAKSVDNDEIDINKLKITKDIGDFRDEISNAVKKFLDGENDALDSFGTFEIDTDEEINEKNNIIEKVDDVINDQVEKINDEDEANAIENILDESQKNTSKGKKMTIIEVQDLVDEETKNLNLQQQQNVLTAVQNVSVKSSQIIKKNMELAKKPTIEKIALKVLLPIFENPGLSKNLLPRRSTFATNSQLVDLITISIKKYKKKLKNIVDSFDLSALKRSDFRKRTTISKNKIVESLKKLFPKQRAKSPSMSTTEINPSPFVTPVNEFLKLSLLNSNEFMNFQE